MTTKNGSRTGKLHKIIGDDYYDLKLGFDQLVELQDLTGRGPHFIANQMRAFDATTMNLVGDFSPAWVYQALRLGLVGGGMKPREAVKFCDQHIREGFIMDYVDTAVEVILAALYGPEEEPDDIAGKSATNQV